MSMRFVALALSFAYCFFDCNSVYSQGPGGGGGPEPITCAVIVEKSCADLFGPFQQEYSCVDTPCENEDYCTTGEALGERSNIDNNENSWSTLKFEAFGGDPGATGQLYRMGFAQRCAYVGHCGYSCERHPVKGDICFLEGGYDTLTIPQPIDPQGDCTLE